MIAAVFPGQGSQHIGMGQDLCQQFPIAVQRLEEAEDILKENLRDIMWNSAPEVLNQTRWTQPCLLTLSVAIFDILRSESNLKYAFFAGHSLGEYSSLVAGESLSFKNSLIAVQNRARIMSLCEGGGMVAVIGLPLTVVKTFLEAHKDLQVFIANDNSPGQVVLSGLPLHLDSIQKELKDLGARIIIPLNVSGAFHSPFMQKAQEEFEPYLEDVSFHDSNVPVFMNTSALAYTQGYELKDQLKKQISSPVRWREIQERLVEYSCNTFIETGPGKVLKGLADRSVPSVKTYLTGTFEALSAFLKNDAPCLACAIP